MKNCLDFFELQYSTNQSLRHMKNKART